MQKFHILRFPCKTPKILPTWLLFSATFSHYYINTFHRHRTSKIISPKTHSHFPTGQTNMHSSTSIPVQNASDPGPMKRHHSARYYAHRVHENLTTRVSKIICAIFLGFLLIVGITAFILWLSLRPHRPRFHIHEFSVPGLSQDNGFDNAQISFNVTARNSNHDIGIYYDAMDGSVYYRDQQIGTLPSLLYPFYQEPKNTTVVDGVFTGASLTVNSQRWMEFLNDRSKGAVVFRLQLTSTIRFKISTWQSHRHRMYANCEVSVGPNGLILPISRNKRCPVYFS